jgi:Domain of unknown function (DUF397)
MSPDSLKVGDLQWRKARRSAANGACVEVAYESGQIFIRDSKDRNGPVVQYSAYSWRMFVVVAKTGRFDRHRL